MIDRNEAAQQSSKRAASVRSQTRIAWAKSTAFLRRPRLPTHRADEVRPSSLQPRISGFQLHKSSQFYSEGRASCNGIRSVRVFLEISPMRAYSAMRSGQASGCAWNAVRIGGSGRLTSATDITCGPPSPTAAALCGRTMQAWPWSSETRMWLSVRPRVVDGEDRPPPIGGVDCGLEGCGVPARAERDPA